jgi:hypothetical protein
MYASVLTPTFLPIVDTALSTSTMVDHDTTGDNMKYDEIFIKMRNSILDSMGVPKSLVSEGSFKYEDPKTGEIFTYQRKGIYKKDGRTLIPVNDN